MTDLDSVVDKTVCLEKFLGVRLRETEKVKSRDLVLTVWDSVGEIDFG